MDDCFSNDVPYSTFENVVHSYVMNHTDLHTFVKPLTLYFSTFYHGLQPTRKPPVDLTTIDFNERKGIVAIDGLASKST